jgi:hypothetical protein
VEVLEFAELLIYRATGGALTLGELNDGKWRPVILSELRWLRLLAIVRQLLQTVVVLQGCVSVCNISIDCATG